jgi:hypothetical protein
VLQSLEVVSLFFKRLGWLFIRNIHSCSTELNMLKTNANPVSAVQNTNEKKWCIFIHEDEGYNHQERKEKSMHK